MMIIKFRNIEVQNLWNSLNYIDRKEVKTYQVNMLKKYFNKIR